LIEGEKLTLKLPVDQYSTPINALDVAKCLRHLLNDNKSGIYHLASTDYLNRVALANRILLHFPEGEYKLDAFKTEDLGQTAPRPLKGGLITQRWNIEYPNFVFSCLEEYITEKLNHIYNLDKDE
jgi:dTDP-4-dehydrorhamnose reductase